ncbi:radical SAM superfamily protein [bacterium BMS3Abin15]|nr:radical SAM superfamily protein [bacterium BMS3Abin15]HDZ86046.1 radical SAM protein [Candidatus Moranbacteria bacterium]
MKNEHLPIYCNKRNFLGKKDLVVSFYTKRCRYGKCTFCAIPSRSSERNVSPDDIKFQIDWVWDKYKSEIDSFEQFSFGNDGSILDEATFPDNLLDYLIDKINQCKKAQVLSLETRAEYIQEERIKNIIKKFKGNVTDVTVGLETQDDEIRNKILNKGLSKELFESKVAILGNLGVRLTSYVMLKPSPYMSEDDGIREAEKTVAYLKETASKNNVDLIIYLCPTYIAKNSDLAKLMYENKYEPPEYASVLRIVEYCHKLKISVYTGLWSEGLAEPYCVCKADSDEEKKIREKILDFNKSVTELVQ